jgi:hypothetical protein
MLDFINSCYLDLINLTKTAPVFGGALMLWLLGTIPLESGNIRIQTIAETQSTFYE